MRPFAVPLTPALADSLRQYLALLLRWNQKINLTATSDVGELLRRHVGESLFGAKLLPAKGGTLYDIGSGAGFPGIPLKLARPDWELVLVESDHRKAAFLSEAVRTLGLGGTRVLAERFDQLAAQNGLADVITVRALGQYEILLDLAIRFLRPSGRVILWLGAEDASRLSGVHGWRWDAKILVPESRERVVLVGTLDA
ncbi:MAG TPA: 16S rRNA (guanine(527)-N(7))-methyltransferase RsmG [Candidatus Acidoferrum sp.]|nr:16S rRNA (guanine(527)-N(7))-methyltransferase RsmG [Candidatus Acidoferrum sp.]